MERRKERTLYRHEAWNVLSHVLHDRLGRLRSLTLMIE